MVLLSVAADAAPPDSPATPAPKNSKPPAPPGDYLRAGARLFNKGRYEEAAKYLDAAHRYHDRLTEDERIVLHVYLEELEKYASRTRTRPRLDPGVVPASTSAAEEKAREEAPTPGNPEAPTPGDAPARASQGPEERRPVEPPGPSRFETTDLKQRARWRLQAAREQIVKGHLDEASRIVDEVRTMEVRWTRFDETPDKMARAIEALRARQASRRSEVAPTTPEGSPPAGSSR